MAGGGSGGEAKIPDVAILIGSCIVAASFILLFWDPSLTMQPSEPDGELPPGTSSTIDTWQTFDLNEGDEVSLDLDLVECPGEDDSGDCGLVSMAWVEGHDVPIAEDWQHHKLKEKGNLQHQFDVSSDGEWTLHLRTDSAIELDIDVEHQWLTPWIVLFVGMGIAVWGYWMSQQQKLSESDNLVVDLSNQSD
ncbi:MAG: hypothetical protein ACKVHH_03720 [Candidatus Poseidoniales archaeon]|jgi:hypothetical protein